MKKVAVVMGSASDLPVVQKATDMLDTLCVPYETHVYSAHRTPQEAIAFAASAADNGFGVIIAFAGMAAHLGGVLAANTLLPVIGVPCKAAALEGMDALLSTVMMPPGVPVATVGINAGVNAALLAAEMLALEDGALRERLTAKRIADAEKVLASDEEITKTYTRSF